MTRARSYQIDLSATPFYHIMTRCVRRSYLCGFDSQTGKDYSHRKEWLVRKIKELASIFSVDIAAYAVMSNHYHLILHVDKKRADNWSYEEIKQRWARVFSSDAEKYDNLEKAGIPKSVLEEKYELWRERLTSISWFMRCLNEPIARLANFEDNCSGRFWEGRFKSQALLSEGAILSAMAYVDLNPIRAGIAITPETSEFTSIHERIAYASKQSNQTKKQVKVKRLSPTAWKNKWDELKQPPHLLPFSNHREKESHKPAIPFSFSGYLQLVEATGRLMRKDKRGYIHEEIKPLLQRLNLDDDTWFLLVNGLERNFSCFVGQEQIYGAMKRLGRKAFPIKRAA